MDAALVSGSIPSFVSLCQSPGFRRQWSSIYAAVHEGRMAQSALMQELVERVETSSQPVLAGDMTF
jgi:hypothetical protein